MAQLRQNPLDFDVLGALRQHCEATRSFALWAEALEEHARAATEADGDPVELGRLHYELGNLYRDQLTRPELALEHYRTAFDFDVAQRPAIAAARALVVSIGDYREAASLLAREAESLPRGPKRASALVELAALYKDRLEQREEAEQALREAIEDDAKNLHVQHELATLLLEDADDLKDQARAESKRREAAGVLRRMASAVSDDYALAYLEGALDAVPDHAPSLALLEEVAPRLNRGDVLAPRWLAAIRSTKDRALARSLRLKMGRAYVAVGQLSDARICLEPLLAEADDEALELMREVRGGGPSSAAQTLDDAKHKGQPEPSSELLLSSEVMLEEGDDPSGLAAQLEELASDAQSASDPLADLAKLDRRKGPSSAPPPLEGLEPNSAERRLDSQETPLANSLDHRSYPPRAAAGESSEDEQRVPDTDRPPARSALLDSNELAIASLGPFESRPPPGATSEAKSGEKPNRTRHTFGLPFDEHEADPFAEETQPRAAPLTLAELTALTGGTQPRATGLPVEDEEEQDAYSEVTQITPAEDPQIAEVRSLRTELARRLRFRDRRGAAEVSETLIDRGVFDPEAIEALEEHYRLTRDFRRLRDLSLRIAREASFASDVRAQRLREAVMLSESKLGDQEGAANALRELLEVEPNDIEAFDKYKRVLTRAQKWDELATALAQGVERSQQPRDKAERLRELATIERVKRGAADRAIEALVRAREIAPEPEDDVALSELYLQAGRYAEAAQALEARVSRAEPGEQPPLLSELARLYEEELRDDAAAQRAFERWRALEPRRIEPLDGIIRVHERRHEPRPLVEALVEKLAVSPPAERGKLHVRIAELALSALGDADRAADAYAEAIALNPQDAALWQAAAEAFDLAGRSEELDGVLWTLAQGTRDRSLQKRLFGHIAETRTQRSEIAGAIVAREAQLAASSEVAVLEALVALLRQTDRASDLARRLDELARRSEPEAARALRLERASVLAEQLRDPEAAKAELDRVLDELSPEDAQALRMLVELCTATGDTRRRASAQERLIKLAPSLSARVELAIELVDLYELELDDTVGAMRVLQLWTTLEPDNPQPYLRLVPLLAQAGRRRELVDANDKLAALAMTEDEAGEFVLRASRVAIELEDFDGAWNRLVPRVVEKGDLAAETLLKELSLKSNRGEQLAALYVGLAQRAEDPQRERQRWVDAARVFEQQVGANDRALEAMLRALAKQLDSEELLHEVERLTEKARAWQRLAQVYDALIRKAPSTSARIGLLMRHGQLLEQRANDPTNAFERVWLAFQLDPGRDETFEEARRLARATGKNEELLSAYERRAQSNAGPDARLAALLDACALVQHEFEDAARATGYLSRAVALAADSSPRLDAIESRARELDSQHPPVHGRGLLAELAGVYTALAYEYTKKPELASVWLSRAARIQEHTLDDPAAAYRALERASALAPGDEALLDELHRVAELAGKWEQLANHLQHTADVAIDSRSSSAALSRLGALYERELSSPTRAADAYEQLVRLRPQDAEASRRLRHCLRAAERYEELLIAIDRELFMIKPEQGKKELLKQAAETWEFGLKNRYEALDAWRKVAALAPQDPEVVAALTRLRSRPRADDSLLDGDLVVRPEDLRPSLASPPVDAAAFTAAASESAPSAPATIEGDASGESERGEESGLWADAWSAAASAPEPRDDEAFVGETAGAEERDAPPAFDDAGGTDEALGESRSTADLAAAQDAPESDAPVGAAPESGFAEEEAPAEPAWFTNSDQAEEPAAARAESTDLAFASATDDHEAELQADPQGEQPATVDDMGEPNERALADSAPTHDEPSALADEPAAWADEAPVATGANGVSASDAEEELEEIDLEELDGELLEISDELDGMSASREINTAAESLPDTTTEFDPDVTIPLDRSADREQAVSVEGLSALVERTREKRGKRRKSKKGPNGRS